jgi:hypothetical protein
VDQSEEAQSLRSKCQQQQEYIEELKAKVGELAEDSKNMNQ